MATKKKTSGKKMTKAQRSANMKKLTSEAKKIRKQNPKMKWQTAVKKAAKK